MDRRCNHSHYWTTSPVSDRKAGSTTLHLHGKFEITEQATQATVVAEVIYWDAAPGYFLQTFGSEVPVEVIEELIAEAKEKIRYF